MNILVSGASGLVGRALIPSLTGQGHIIKTLVRHASTQSSEIEWNPLQTGPAPDALQGIEAVIHMAGESIASGRWTAARKRAILESRVTGTRLLSEAIARMTVLPKVVLSASAIGYYGDRGHQLLQEGSAPGQGFLPDVCNAWEAASRPLSQKGIRVVHLRFGIVLSPEGGALQKMLPPFRMGVAGRLGPGTQFMSWIALNDVVGAIHHALSKESLEGPVNTVSPNAVTNAEFTETLGRVVQRPTAIPMPVFLAQLLFGEMADALLLTSTRVEPAKLSATGYAFQFPDLEGALRHLLKK